MIKKSTWTQVPLILVAAAFLFPLSAEANVGVPMLFVSWGAMLLALLPIIVIETCILSMQLGLSLGSSIKVAAIANGVSTLIGIPVAWFLLVLAQMFTGGGSAYGLDTAWKKFLAVTWQAPWLIPYEDDLDWMVPSAGLALLVPFFFASWWIEAWVVSYYVHIPGQVAVSHAVLIANQVTYGILALLGLGLLANTLNLPSRLKAVMTKLWPSSKLGTGLDGTAASGVSAANRQQQAPRGGSRKAGQDSPVLVGGGDDD